MAVLVFCNVEECFNNKDQRCNKLNVVLIDGVCRSYPHRKREGGEKE